MHGRRPNSPRSTSATPDPSFLPNHSIDMVAACRGRSYEAARLPTQRQFGRVSEQRVISALRTPLRDRPWPSGIERGVAREWPTETSRLATTTRGTSSPSAREGCMPQIHLGVVVVLLSSAASVQSTSPSFDITISTGQHERKNVPVRVQLPLSHLEHARVAFIALTRGTARPSRRN